MYYYIVDPQHIRPRQFERVQNQLYSSISEYKINGEIVRVTGIRTIKQLVETAIFHQANTIVAVGSDHTLNEVINILGERQMILGFIPLTPTLLSDIFGIPSIPVACKNLAVRRVEEVDVGVVNDRLFLGRLTFGLGKLNDKSDFFKLKLLSHLWNRQPFEVKFQADDQFTGTSEVLGGVIEKMASPKDGVLTVSLISRLSRSEIFRYRNFLAAGEYTKIPNASVLRVKKFAIAHPPTIPVKLDDKDIATTPITVSVKPKAVKIIVGRDRKF